VCGGTLSQKKQQTLGGHCMAASTAAYSLQLIRNRFINGILQWNELGKLDAE